MIDILAIGAHPDDVELGCGGILLKQKRQGSSIKILDLTEGDLGTRGNPELRKKEAQAANDIMGFGERLNLGFRDGFFQVDENHIREVVKVIRQLKPKIILCNALEDRHPDHGKAADLIKKACFYSGLVKFETSQEGEKQDVWRPESIYHYVQFKYLRPDIIIDITEEYEIKMKAIMAHKSQFFDPMSNEPETMISSKEFLEFLDARMIEFGRVIGVKYAEGLNIHRIPSIENLHHLK